jgi:cell division protein FtsQ
MKINFTKSMGIIPYALIASAIIWLLAMPINSIRVNDSNNNVAASAVIAKIRPVLKYGWFYTNLDNMAQEIQQIPWVDAVNIVRLSPLELEINIVEKNPVARWKEDSLVSDKGNIFFIADNGSFIKLPLLEAELIEANDAITTYFALSQYLNLTINKELKGLKTISCSEAYGCRIMFGNKLLLKIGAENITEKLQRFFHFLPKIIANNHRKMPKSIDMRYANGAAVA